MQPYNLLIVHTNEIGAVTITQIKITRLRSSDSISRQTSGVSKWVHVVSEVVVRICGEKVPSLHVGN